MASINGLMDYVRESLSLRISSGVFSKRCDYLKASLAEWTKPRLNFLISSKRRTHFEISIYAHWRRVDVMSSRGKILNPFEHDDLQPDWNPWKYRLWSIKQKHWPEPSGDQIQVRFPFTWTHIILPSHFFNACRPASNSDRDWALSPSCTLCVILIIMRKA